MTKENGLKVEVGIINNIVILKLLAMQVPTNFFLKEKLQLIFQDRLEANASLIMNFATSKIAGS